MQKIVCPNCKKELDRIVEEGNELQAVKTFWIWKGERYEQADEERDYTDYQFDGYFCPECGERLDIKQVTAKQ
jgi:uncharacterized protein YlaI